MNMGQAALEHAEKTLASSERNARVAAAIREERCNGCGVPRAQWGPICGGMLQGDMTHFHSPEFWRNRVAASAGGGDQ